MGKNIGLTQLPARLAKDRRGASAVEFAIIAPVFLALTFSILEAGFYFFVTSTVDAANTKAARLIRTGQAAGGGINRDVFFNEICKTVRFVGNCDTRLTVDVARYSTFAELAADSSAPVCRDADPDDVDDIPFETGNQRDIVRVRICFLYDGFNPGLGLNLERAGDGSHKMISTSIFRNEPFASS